ncbi:hypothetical protein J6590_086759 [Homalodisca vitripennis]|nr:hypothetical protein J6590_086759 [Homalodisca vitripennis]
MGKIRPIELPMNPRISTFAVSDVPLLDIHKVAQIEVAHRFLLCPVVGSTGRYKPARSDPYWVTMLSCLINNYVSANIALQSRPPNKAGGWICAAATYGTGEAEEGRESVALRHKLATLCAHCCLVQVSRRRCSFHTPPCQCQCQSYCTV